MKNNTKKPEKKDESRLVPVAQSPKKKNAEKPEIPEKPLSNSTPKKSKKSPKKPPKKSPKKTPEKSPKSNEQNKINGRVLEIYWPFDNRIFTKNTLLFVLLQTPGFGWFVVFTTMGDLPPPAPLLPPLPPPIPSCVLQW